MLLKNQKNELFIRLQNRGFNLSSFEPTQFAGLKQKNLQHAFQIKHSESGYYFTVEEVDGRNEPTFYYEYYPSEKNMRVNNLTVGLNSFESVLPYFEKWMEFIKKELEIIDLWELNGKMRTALEEITSYSDNSPIKPDEIEKTTEVLEEFGKYLKVTIPKNDENESDVQLQQIQSNVAFLINALPRFGRKDYLVLVLSFFINIISTLTVSETTAKGIMEFARAVYNILYPGNPPLLN